MMKKLISTLLLLAAALLASTASAADPFTVSGVPVDATGANAIEAQTLAITEGQALAAQVLIDRVTLRSERATKRFAPLDTETIARLIRALEISNEKRSANRYLGDITVAFNPSQVQKLLQSRGLTMVSTQARPRLVLPIQSGNGLWTSNNWSAAMSHSAFEHSLTPLRSVMPGKGDALITTQAAQAADIAALRRVGQRFGVDQVLIAVASPGGQGVTVQMTDVALDTGNKRNLGSVTAPDYVSASAAVVDRLESSWKQASVSLAQNAENMTVSVLYRTHEDWLRLQDAINGSAQIQGARLDALSKEGALMTLSYGGDMERLRNELAFKGVDVSQDPELGVVLSRSRRR